MAVHFRAYELDCGGKWSLAIGLEEYRYVEWQYLLTDEEILKVMLVPKHIGRIVMGAILLLFSFSFFNVPFPYAMNPLLWILSTMAVAGGYATYAWLMGEKLTQISPEELSHKWQVRERIPWSEVQSITVEGKRFTITYYENKEEMSKLMLKLVNDDVIQLQMFLRSKVVEKLRLEG